MKTKSDTITFEEIFGPVHKEHVLPELDDRDLLLELHWHTESGELLVARTQILGVTAGHLLVDKPKTLDKVFRFSEGMTLEAYMHAFGSTYTFQSVVASTNSIVRLNGQNRILGMILTRPTEMVEGQKRENRRIALKDGQPLVYQFHEMAGGRFATSSPIDVRHLTGQVVNFSRGGIAVRMDGRDVEALCPGDCYTFRFDLPDSEGGTWFAVELRYIEPMGTNDGAILGFKFLQLPNPRVFREMLRPIVRYIRKNYGH